MSVSTLEEKLEKVAGFNNDATNLQQLRKEHAQLRLLLQERSLELEERDAVLAKARNAIEQLRSEVTKLRDGQSDDDSGDAAAIERERDELAREKVACRPPSRRRKSLLGQRGLRPQEICGACWIKK